MALATAPADTATTALISAEQLVDISQDDSHRYELLNGELIIMSPTGGRHGQLASRLIAKLIAFAEEHNSGETFASETGFRLTRAPDTVLAPDAAFITADNLAAGRVTEAFIPGAPDIVVEVLSPSDTAGRTAVKVQTWLRHGAQLVWIVDPESTTVTVYRADGSAALRQSGDSLDGETVLPGFSYPLDQLFR